MTSPADIQTLLRFLSQDAKMPLAMAMGSVKSLQDASLTSPEAISKSNFPALSTIFPTEKSAKMVLAASKRVSKKRASTSTTAEPPAKKTRRPKPESEQETPEAIESALALPEPCTDEAAIRDVVLVTNRAPLVLAFATVLLKYTMPEQPLSSRLSLAQAVVSVNSRSKAVNIGLESGRSAEEEGYGDGQPTARVMGREIKVMKRWGYEWKEGEGEEKDEGADINNTETKDRKAGDDNEDDDPTKATSTQSIHPAVAQPALWALDLEALKRSTNPSNTAPSSNPLPIHTPTSARSYLLKSFASPPSPTPTAPSETKTKTKTAAADLAARKEHNLALLLGALDLLFRSWAPRLGKSELDARAWSWYVATRPAVASGAAGWGGRGEVRLSAILALCRDGSGRGDGGA